MKLVKLIGEMLILIIVVWLLMVASFKIGEYRGKRLGKSEAYDSIILEECWLNQETRDIDCIEYMKD